MAATAVTATATTMAGTPALPSGAMDRCNCGLLRLLLSGHRGHRVMVVSHVMAPNLVRSGTQLPLVGHIRLRQ
jgi:hypothetical protein